MQPCRTRPQTECTIECRGQFEQGKCPGAGNERRVSVRTAVRQVTNVVRRYQDVVVIRTKEQCTQHGQKEHPQSDQGVARPYERHGDEWRDEDNNDHEDVLRRAAVRCPIPCARYRAIESRRDGLRRGRQSRCWSTCRFRVSFSLFQGPSSEVAHLTNAARSWGTLAFAVSAAIIGKDAKRIG